MRTVDELIQQAVSDGIPRSDAEAACAANGKNLDELYNEISIRIAKQFQAGAMSYHDGDAAMNSVFVRMVDDAARFGDGFSFAEPAYSIYLAFDAGEYDHGDGADPVEKFTKPLIEEIVRRA